MEDLLVRPGLTIPARELLMRFTRAGGPGGQNVNKRATKVEVIFDVATSGALTEDQRARILERLRPRLDAAGRLRVVSEEERTQRGNRERALARLATLLARALEPPPKPRRPTAPSRTAKERRLSEKRARGVVKQARRRPEQDE